MDSKSPKKIGRRGRSSRGFTLVELLAALAVVLVLSAASSWAFQSLAKAGAVDRGVSDLSESVDVARTYALANHTYVRMVFAPVPATSNRLFPATLVLLISAREWRARSGQRSGQHGQPVEVAGHRPPGAAEQSADEQHAQHRFARYHPGLDADSIRHGFQQRAFLAQRRKHVAHPLFFRLRADDPAGEIQVLQGTPVRFIKMAFDQPAPQNGINPFIVRVSGISGAVGIFRKENGIH